MNTPNCHSERSVGIKASAAYIKYSLTAPWRNVTFGTNQKYHSRFARISLAHSANITPEHEMSGLRYFVRFYDILLCRNGLKYAKNDIISIKKHRVFAVFFD